MKTWKRSIALLVLSFPFTVLGEVSYTCSQGDKLIGKNCWTLQDLKYPLDNSVAMGTLCKSGYRIPTKEEYVEVEQVLRSWKELEINSREHYVTSTKNELGHFFFVTYAGTRSGFFAEPRGGGTYTHARCIKPATQGEAPKETPPAAPPVTGVNLACPTGENLIGNNCWTLEDKKYLLDNSQPISSMCKAGYKVPPKEEFEAVEKSRMWNLLNIQSKEYYLTSTKNAQGHYFFVAYYGTQNGFFAEPRGSGTWVYSRCFAPAKESEVAKPAPAPVMETEVLQTLDETARAVIAKADEELIATYNKANTTQNSEQHGAIFKEAMAINEAKNAIVVQLGQDAQTLFEHSVTKAQTDSAIDPVVVGSYNLYEMLRAESQKTVTKGGELDKQYSAHQSGSVDIIPSGQGQGSNPNQQTPEQKPSQGQTKFKAGDLKSNLRSGGDVAGIQGGYSDLVKSLQSVGILMTANLFAGHSGSPSAGSAGSGASNLSVLPELDTSKIASINNTRKTSNKPGISLGQAATASTSASSTGTGASYVAGASGATTSVAAAADSFSSPSTAQKQSSVSSSNASGATATEKKKEPNLTIVANSYQTQSYLTELTAKGENEIADMLITMEKKINYRPVTINKIPPSQYSHRTSTNLSGLLGGASNPREIVDRLAKQVIEKKRQLIQKRENLSKVKMTDSEKRQAETDLLMEEHWFITGDLYHFGSALFRNATNFCPSGSSIHLTWQRVNHSNMGNEHLYACEVGGEIYEFRFGQNVSQYIQEIIDHFRPKQSYQGVTVENSDNMRRAYNGDFSDMAKSVYNVFVNDFECPSTWNLNIYGKKVVGNLVNTRIEYRDEAKKDRREVYCSYGYTYNP